MTDDELTLLSLGNCVTRVTREPIKLPNGVTLVLEFKGVFAKCGWSEEDKVYFAVVEDSKHGLALTDASTLELLVVEFQKLVEFLNEDF